MTLKCVNPACTSSHLIKDGAYYRISDRKHVQRWKCKKCKTRFSAATRQKAYLQNKRQVNHSVFNLLASGVSMRRISLILNIHRITVARKLAFLAEIAREKQDAYLCSRLKIRDVQFDDLITIEHTKYKPLTVSLAVENKTRQMLDFEVSVIPASGHLAEISRSRYGWRPDERKRGIMNLFGRIGHYLDKKPVFSTDEDTLYPGLIKRAFPDAVHKQYAGAKSRERGLGELKKLKYDPLFSINHTLAMLRANINRLFRRTWCTTKKRERLAQHIMVYMLFHNSLLTNCPVQVG